MQLQIRFAQRYSRGRHEAKLRWRARGYRSQALHEGPEDVVGDEDAEWIVTAVLFRSVRGMLRADEGAQENGCFGSHAAIADHLLAKVPVHGETLNKPGRHWPFK